MVTKVKELIMDYYEDFEMVARLYTLLALVSFVLDVISFFIVFGFLAKIQSDAEDLNILDIDDVADLLLTAGNPHLGRIFVIMLYTICDIVYLLWVIHFRSRLGEAEKVYVLKALLGFGNAMRVAWKVPVKGSRGEAPGASSSQRGR